MNIPDIIWKEVPDTRYYASECGKIARKVKGEIVIRKPRMNKQTGYPQVDTHREGVTKTRPIHVLIAAAWIGPRPEGLVINHIDGDKLNNKASNLEYITRSGNSIHAYKMGLTPPPPKYIRTGKEIRPKGIDHKKSKLNDDIVRDIMSSPLGCRKLGKKYNVCKDTIAAVRRGETWKHVTLSQTST